MVFWQHLASETPPGPFISAIKSLHPEAGNSTAQVLWQRGWRNIAAIKSFLFPENYEPTSAFAFAEMSQAVERIAQARADQEKLAIWGDFDADGMTATAVLWEGLGQFFRQNEQLVYYIPNRLTESHGLSMTGLAQLQAQGCTLIITCDTGSTNLAEIRHATGLGMDVIITDHHTLPPYRPNVTAIINPREFPDDHPLHHLSGVAVAYKLIEALYAKFPEIPQGPLEAYLDLVAIGLIADLVELRGDCRYLAQRGIEQLKDQQRPGVKALLANARKRGDRPTDISFGLGPRINAVSRIYGDAGLCVELLTTRDPKRAEELAQAAELANDRRKALQKTIIKQAEKEISRLDLSTTYVIVLMHPQWSVGLVGVAAGQLAKKYGRPVILLRAEGLDLGDEDGADLDFESAPFNPQADGNSPPDLAMGSARSIGGLDFYELLNQHLHLFHRFGGHPFAAGLSLPIQNVPLLREALNQTLGQQWGGQPPAEPAIQIDLDVTVAELGPRLFRELKLLEPYDGLGNPAVTLRVRGVEILKPWRNGLKDIQGQSQNYSFVTFTIVDPESRHQAAGIWWDHQPEDIPLGLCDLVGELNFNTKDKKYVFQVNDLQPAPYANVLLSHAARLEILDYRYRPTPPLPETVLTLETPPQTWAEWRQWLSQAWTTATPLALIYGHPPRTTPTQAWQRLIGITKHLSRTGAKISLGRLQTELGISELALTRGLDTLTALGVEIFVYPQPEQPQAHPAISCRYPQAISRNAQAVEQFALTIAEEQFRRHYLAQVPTPTLRQVAGQSD
ncbi:DHH family phosphoesterase [Synechococcus sp. PCC 6312]|uniref:single-stranded-DNA-specific exonuclease RecJ n=1 Tax=Synechococcus sp. (strain ATCC 27167 / PCC 6312) TaxID=195253 RepID=UPI00029ECFFA|nr:DHH family phosphoesterase [Synechococcus sp. PCC 6312]AFY62727.1 single-stranded DNA-specific exonuclease [Synechococcus sp. PCC 6312]